MEFLYRTPKDFAIGQRPIFHPGLQIELEWVLRSIYILSFVINENKFSHLKLPLQFHHLKPLHLHIPPFRIFFYLFLYCRFSTMTYNTTISYNFFFFLFLLNTISYNVFFSLHHFFSLKSLVLFSNHKNINTTIKNKLKFNIKLSTKL